MPGPGEEKTQAVGAPTWIAGLQSASRGRYHLITASMAAASHWVFSFGSNNSQQLAGRVLTSTCAAPLSPPRPARLDGYARVFTHNSAVWSGAVANLVPCSERHVLGTLTALTPEQLDRLDEYERAYAKETVHVLDLSARTSVSATAFIMQPSPAFSVPPSEAYCAAIWRTLVEAHGASVDSIPLLRQSAVGGPVEPFGAGLWRRPGAAAQLSTVFALMYEVGATAQPPWVLPRAAADATTALEHAGVSSVQQLLDGMHRSAPPVMRVLGPSGVTALKTLLNAQPTIDMAPASEAVAP